MPRNNHSRLLLRLSLGVIGSSFIATSCTQVPRTHQIVARNAASIAGNIGVPVRPQWVARDSATSVDGIYALTGDRTSAASWFLTNASSSVYLVRISGDGAFTWWPLPSGSSPADRNSAISIGSAGRVWVALGDRLDRIDLATSQIDRFILPAPTPSKAAARFTPVPLQDEHPINSIAAMADGTVAISRVGAAVVQILNPRAHTVRSVSLPSSTVAEGLAADPRDRLFIAVGGLAGAPNTVLEADPSGAMSTYSVATSVVSASNGVVLLGSVPGLYSLNPNASTGSGRVRRVDATALSGFTSTSTARPLVGQADVSLAGGGYAYGTVDGIVAVSSQGQTSEFDLPAYSCPNQSGSANGDPNTTCDAFPLSLTVDGTNDIWYVSSAPSSPIGMIPANELP